VRYECARTDVLAVCHDRRKELAATIGTKHHRRAANRKINSNMRQKVACGDISINHRLMLRQGVLLTKAISTPDVTALRDELVVSEWAR